MVFAFSPYVQELTFTVISTKHIMAILSPIILLLPRIIPYSPKQKARVWAFIFCTTFTMHITPHS